MAIDFETRTRRTIKRVAHASVGGWDVVIAFGLYLGLQILLGAVVGAIGGIYLAANGWSADDIMAAMEGAAATIILLAIAAVGAIIGAAFVAARRRSSVPSLFGLGNVSGRWLALGAGAGLLGLPLNWGAVSLYIWLTGDASNPQAGMTQSTTDGTPAQFALLMLLGCLLVPFGEELLFRGVLYNWLKRWGIPLAIVASSIVFGLFHGVNAVMPAAVVIGAVFAILYERSGSLWPAIFAHAINNAFAFTLPRLLM